MSNSSTLDFMANRRSCPAVRLDNPVPSSEEIMGLLTLAARVPDHGQLVPWRFIIIEEQQMSSLAQQLNDRGLAMGKAPSLVAKAAQVFGMARLVVAVVFSPVLDSKIPRIEQQHSASAVCISLLNAALASGWGANWLTGFGAHDSEYRERALGLASHESVAGFIHIGTAKSVPADRPRPDISSITSWLSS